MFFVSAYIAKNLQLKETLLTFLLALNSSYMTMVTQFLKEIPASQLTNFHLCKTKFWPGRSGHHLTEVLADITVELYLPGLK